MISRQVLVILYALSLLGFSGMLDLLGAEFLHIALLLNGMVVFYLSLRLEEFDEIILTLSILNGVATDCFWGRPGIGFLLYGTLSAVTIYVLRERYDSLLAELAAGIMPIWLLGGYLLLQFINNPGVIVAGQWCALLVLAMVCNVILILPLMTFLDNISRKLHLLPEKY